MKQKMILLSAAAALGGLAGLLDGVWAGSAGWAAWSSPLLLAGTGLRKLSLSGFAGNLAAWAVVLAVCALPLLPLLRRLRKGLRREDWLLLLPSPLLFALIFCAVNPTLPGEPLSAVFPLAAAGTALSAAAAWFILKLLRGLDGAPAEKLAGIFRGLLRVCAGLLVFGAVWGRLGGALERCRSVLAGNTSVSGSVRFTLAALVLLAALNLIPDLLAGLTLLWGGDLAGMLGGGPFAPESVALCRRTAVCCQRVARATVLLAVLSNLLQLLLLGRLHDSSFSVTLPLFSLMLSAGLFLLCRCLQRGRELQSDSDSII